MNEPSDGLTPRLYERLLEAVAARPGDAGPVTIGEIYRDLIPYRSMRGELGVFELAAYEHSLLRLLAGEAGPIRAADPAARGEFVAELASPNPILGIYRDYSGLEVALDGVVDPAPRPRTEAAVRRTDSEVDTTAAEDVDPPAGPPAGTGNDEDAPSSLTLPRVDPPTTPQVVPADATRVSLPQLRRRPDAEGGDDRRCIDCGEALPQVNELRFCPHCGTDQTQLPCARCSTPLRADWKFCIRCGTPRATS